MAGRRYHAVADEGIAFRELAESIGHRLGLPVRSLEGDEASAHFGPLAFIVPADNPVSSALTREWLGWEPVQPGLFADLGLPHYFET